MMGRSTRSGRRMSGMYVGGAYIPFPKEEQTAPENTPPQQPRHRIGGAIAAGAGMSLFLGIATLIGYAAATWHPGTRIESSRGHHVHVVPDVYNGLPFEADVAMTISEYTYRDGDGDITRRFTQTYTHVDPVDKTRGSIHMVSGESDLRGTYDDVTMYDANGNELCTTDPYGTKPKCGPEGVRATALAKGYEKEAFRDKDPRIRVTITEDSR
jgi:hypothetical protein